MLLHQDEKVVGRRLGRRAGGLRQRCVALVHIPSIPLLTELTSRASVPAACQWSRLVSVTVSSGYHMAILGYFAWFLRRTCPLHHRASFSLAKRCSLIPFVPTSSWPIPR